MATRAERFRDLEAPALIDLRARTTPSGGSQAAQALAQSLGAFSNTAFQVSSRLSTIRGTKEGAREGATGTPEFRKGIFGMTAFGRAYNDSALRSYAIKSEIDMEENAARLEAEAGTDPEAFGSAMVTIRDATLEEAPPETHSLITQIYNKRTAAGLARIQTALVAELRAEGKVLVVEQTDQLIERIALLRSQDTPEAFVAAEQEEAKLEILLDAAEADDVLSESEARVARKEAQRGIIFETVISRFKNELDDDVFGDPVGFIEDLKEVNRIADTLTPDEEARLEAELFAELREHNTLRSTRAAEAEAEATARFEAGDREATSALYRGELTNSDLIQMVEDQELEPSVSRTLFNMKKSAAAVPPKSDPETLFKFATNLLSVTEEEIRAEQSLTWADREKLTLQRREDEASWKGTQVAKEAFDRIDRALGIISGSIAAMLLSDSDARKRDTAFTKLYNVIDALPPEERQGAILEESEKVIRIITREQDAGKLERQRRMLTEYIAEHESQYGSPGEYKGDLKETYEREIRRRENLIRELEAKTR